MTPLPVLIPTHTRRDLLQRAVASCVPHPVVVVDDSPAGMAPLPHTTWLRSPGDTGFARAVNLGLAHLARQGARAVLVLNDDATVTAADIACLHHTWRRLGGVVGPVMEGTDGRIQSAGFSLGPSGRLRARRVHPTSDRPVPVAALSGACMVMGTTWRFDPHFRHGMEDIELCQRVQRAGGSVVVEPRARCQHAGGGTVSVTSARAQRAAVAGHIRLVGGGWRTGVVIGLAVAQVIREGGPFSRFGAIWQGVTDAHHRAF